MHAVSTLSIYISDTYVEVKNGGCSFSFISVFQSDNVGAQLDLVPGDEGFFGVLHAKVRWFSNLGTKTKH
jgi:hypothetical protein